MFFLTLARCSSHNLLAKYRAQKSFSSICISTARRPLTPGTYFAYACDTTGNSSKISRTSSLSSNTTTGPSSTFFFPTPVPPCILSLSWLTNRSSSSRLALPGFWACAISSAFNSACLPSQNSSSVICLAMTNSRCRSFSAAFFRNTLSRSAFDRRRDLASPSSAFLFRVTDAGVPGVPGVPGAVGVADGVSCPARFADTNGTSRSCTSCRSLSLLAPVNVNSSPPSGTLSLNLSARDVRALPGLDARRSGSASRSTPTVHARKRLLLPVPGRGHRRHPRHVRRRHRQRPGHLFERCVVPRRLCHGGYETGGRFRESVE